MEVISRKDARQKGLRRYFTGKPCKHGHLTHRSVSCAICAACERDRQNAKRKRNPEKEKALCKAWAKRNPEKYIAHAHRWKKNNPEKARDNERQNSKLRRYRKAAQATPKSGAALGLAEALEIFKAQDNAFDFCEDLLRE